MKKAIFAIIVIIILGYVVYSNTGDRALAPVENGGISNEMPVPGNDVTDVVVIPDDGGSASGTVPAGGSACANMGGTLDAIHGECLGIVANACQEIGGTFNECASACRHDPTAEVCTMQCVQVCEVE